MAHDGRKSNGIGFFCSQHRLSLCSTETNGDVSLGKVSTFPNGIAWKREYWVARLTCLRKPGKISGKGNPHQITLASSNLKSPFPHPPRVGRVSKEWPAWVPDDCIGKVMSRGMCVITRTVVRKRANSSSDSARQHPEPTGFIRFSFSFPTLTHLGLVPIAATRP